MFEALSAWHHDSDTPLLGNLLPAYQGPSLRRRAFSVLLVTGLHAALLFAMLHFMVQQHSRHTATAERILEMILRPQRVVVPAPMAPTQRKHVPRPQPERSLTSPAPSSAPPASAPDLSGLGRSLAECAPENWGNLSRDERARCPGILHKPDETEVAEPRSHVKDPARRTAEMAAKNGQARIPCTSVAKVMTGAGAVAVPMLDPGCALKGANEGFGPLNGLPK